MFPTPKAASKGALEGYFRGRFGPKKGASIGLRNEWFLGRVVPSALITKRRREGSAGAHGRAPLKFHRHKHILVLIVSFRLGLEQPLGLSVPEVQFDLFAPQSTQKIQHILGVESDL